MGPECTMGPGIILVLMALLHSGAAFLKSEAYFNETAALPCQFSNSQNLSLNELVIFWQYQQKLVLYEFYLGRENFNNVAPSYMYRTSFDQNSWTLRLHRAQIKDKGIYQCIIHHKKPTGLVSIHQKDSELSVFANFTEPEIVQMSNVTGNSGMNLTCSSGQGYPQAMKMYFLLKLENSTELEYDGVMQISQDNDTELYNISISSYVPFPDDMSNVTIFCVLKTKSMRSKDWQLSSKPFYKDQDHYQTHLGKRKTAHSKHLARVPSHHLPATHQSSWIIAVVLISVIFGCGLGCFLWKKKKKQQAVVSHKRETTRMEKENNEETEGRMNIHISERNDKEVQCVVQPYSLKMLHGFD
ncbi:T-lymphocyte activation antigen CD86 isoform X2 [Heterocephalus glaber]|uniref:T-lymphocyte activation antigen CD86 n=1 Tax=Heterocephalus glaber TaxID=10181 RepID=A0AAX6QGF7_HETGA|nr:T-lymphocyte activation antigen CD86 isoform X2 [Heterocephalus glaber]